jgi:hypothetical protein
MGQFLAKSALQNVYGLIISELILNQNRPKAVNCDSRRSKGNESNRTVNF